LRLLLDSHIFVWWLGDDSRLGQGARNVIADQNNLIHVSAASVWELEIKQALGRLTIRSAELLPQIATNGFIELRISAGHAVMAARLPLHHRDPFDRMLIAQALSEGLVLLSDDAAMGLYEAPLLSAT
jgi:PIN domain nuclease of toxin-antitoxin system